MLLNRLAVLHTLFQSEWQTVSDETAVTALEQGKLLFLPHLKFELNAAEKKLISPDLSNGKAKNISFNALTQDLKGISAKISAEETHSIKNILKRYAEQSLKLIKSLMPDYQTALRVGRTSLRPVEIEGRKIYSYRKDDTRLHVDAFPANPNQGFRILRVFCNIHPHKPRVWQVGESFEKVAQAFLPIVPKQLFFSGFLLKSFKITKSLRTPYDHIMLNIHNAMKKDERYQQQVKQTLVPFPPQSAWIVYTDQVSHAALSGQHILEQTFYLPVHAMQDENRSPLRILEKMKGKNLV